MFERIQEVFADFSEDEIFTRASSLAYYSALAMAPLIVLFVWGLSVIGSDLQHEFVENAQSLVGPEGGKVIAAIIQGADKHPDLSSLSGWIGLAGLLFSASVIFGQLQETLNLIFDTERENGAAQPVWHYVWSLIFDRIISIGMLMTFLFLAISSLFLSSAIAYFFRGVENGGLQLVFTLGNLIVFGLLFALIFKAMPDREIDGRAALIGGAITSFLFAIGKLGVSYYLARASVGSAYGAAGSFAVLLVWLYYSSIIFYFGAEIAFAFLVKAHEQKPTAI